jgi:hypothetical protein
MLYSGLFTYPQTRVRAYAPSSNCHLDLHQRDDCVIAVATELHDNAGASITNTTEDLATAIVQQFDLDPATTTFVEHYNAYSYSAEPSLVAIKQHPDTYSLVSFIWKENRATSPQWSHLTPKAFEKKMQQFAESDGAPDEEDEEERLDRQAQEHLEAAARHRDDPMF